MTVNNYQKNGSLCDQDGTGSPDQQRNEVRKSTAQLAKETNSEISLLSFPEGKLVIKIPANQSEIGDEDVGHQSQTDSHVTKNKKKISSTLKFLLCFLQNLVGCGLCSTL